MKKLITSILFGILAVSQLNGCTDKTKNITVENTEPSLVLGLNEDDFVKIPRDNEQSIENEPDIKFKEVKEQGKYDDENISFSLNFESPLAAYRCSTSTICVYNENSNRPSLEGGDFEIELHLNNDSDSAYDNLLDSLTSQSFKLGGNISPSPYFFPLSDEDREKEVDVQVIQYPENHKLDIYFLYWKANGKKDFIVIRDYGFDFPKRSNDLDGIIQTIQLK